MRDTALGKTVQLDKAEVGCEEPSECESGGGRFQIASADGSRVLFTDTQRLSKDSGASLAKEEADLYECKLTVNGGGELACALTDLTPANGGESADVQGDVLGFSRDSSYLYFVARGVQSEAANGRGQKAERGKPNLYERHEGQTSFIATLAGGDQQDWSETLENQPTRVSANGQWLALMSQRSLTGYDNRDAVSNQPDAEVYLYDSSTGRLRCASCEPSGERPVGVEYHKIDPEGGVGLAGGPFNVWEESALVAANVPGWTAIGSGVDTKSRYQPRYLSESGRLFFNSGDGLVTQDANGTEDVYQYEPPGVGSCTTESTGFSIRDGGCVALISSGASTRQSQFLDASESGDDVFFVTAEKLVPQDPDTARDVYDAHECTNSSPCITCPSVQSPPCTTEASCKASPTPQPSIFGAPASATFSGPGNLIQPLVSSASAGSKAKGLTRHQRLVRALRSCRKKPKRLRASCEHAARKKYGSKSKPKKRSKK